MEREGISTRGDFDRGFPGRLRWFLQVFIEVQG